MRELSFLSTVDAVGQAELIAKKELSAAEVREACVARIEALNPLLRAVVTLQPETHEPKAGPFAGVPLLIKDVSPWPGMRWSMGARAFGKNVAAEWTPFAQRLHESGFVAMGKTASSELGLLGSTETLLEGVTHNPWDLSRSAAGSSGGAAAAVASGMVPLAHANDGGGSIRVPASVCGLFGFAPSRGRSVSNMLAQSDFGDLTIEHCISRSVRDSARFLTVVQASAQPAVIGPSSRKLRIGAWSKSLVGSTPQPEVQRAFEEAVALVQSLGHEVRVSDGPNVDGPALRDAFFIVAGAASSGVIDMLGGATDGFEPFTVELAAHFRKQGVTALDAARETLRRCAKQYLNGTRDLDVCLTPTLATLPWKLGHLSPLLSRAELISRTTEAVCFTPIHNAAGAPAMSVPLHVTPEGLPVGVMFAAAPGNDATLLELAFALEEARPWKDRLPPIHAASVCRKS